MKNITNQSRYLTLPLLPSKRGYFTNYLSRNLEVLEHAFRKYSKVFAFRVDLRLPDDFNYYDTNLITRFFASLKAMLNADYANKKRNCTSYVHPSELIYVWTRELGHSGKPHYHVCILLNGHAYRSLGIFQEGRENLYNKIISAWQSALYTHFYHNPFCFKPTLVSFPPNSEYFIERNKQGFDTKYRTLFKRLSYFAKIESKPTGLGVRNYGTSRIPLTVTV